MKVVSLGYIAVTAGTPILLSSLVSASISACEIFFQPINANTGKTYVGLVGFNKTSGAGVLCQLNLPSAVFMLDKFRICSPSGTNTLRPADYAIDGDTTADLVLVTYSVE